MVCLGHETPRFSLCGTGVGQPHGRRSVGGDYCAAAGHCCTGQRARQQRAVPGRERRNGPCRRPPQPLAHRRRRCARSPCWRGVKPEDVQPTPVAGIFEVRRGADILYMTRDGQYVFTGDLYQVPTPRQSDRSAPARAAAQADRRRARIADGGVLAAAAQIYHHRVHRRRLRLLPRVASADRRLQPARRAGALRVLTRAPARTPSPGTRPSRCGARPTARRR